MRNRILLVVRDVEPRAHIARLLSAAGHGVEIAEGMAHARRLNLKGIALAVVAPEGLGPEADAFVAELSAAKTTLLIDAAAGPPRQGHDVLGVADDKALLARVGAALGRGLVPANGADGGLVARFAEYSLDLAGHCLTNTSGAEIPLTRGEFNLLREFVRRPGRVLSRDDLLRALAGRDAEYYDRSIDMLVMRLRRKIEADPKHPALIGTVPGSGYKFLIAVRTIEAAATPHPEPASDTVSKTGSTGTSGPTPRSLGGPFADPDIFVIPFQSRGSGSEEQYLSELLTEDLVTCLAGFSSSLTLARRVVPLHVIRSPDISGLTHGLTSGYVVQGSVAHAGERALTSVRLVDIQAGTYLWADRFDATARDLRQPHSEVASRIAWGVMLAIMEASPCDAGPRPVNADDLIIRGQALINRPVSRANREEALRCFELALVEEPNSLDARLGAAGALISNLSDGRSRFEARDKDRAEKYILDALLRRSDMPEPHTLMGILRRLQGRLDDSRVELEMAINIAPNHALANSQLGQTFAYLCQPKAGLRHVERSIRLAPNHALTPGYYYNLGLCHLLMNNVNEAVGFARIARAGNPTLYYTHMLLASGLGLRHEYDEAGYVLAEAIKCKPELATMRGLQTLTLPYSSESVALRQATLWAGLRNAGLSD
jgi:TolB-like protein/Tfp pilus assembly protein PilF